MLNPLIHVWPKHSQIAIACLGLVPLGMSCATTNVPEPPTELAASSAPETAVVVEETSSPQSALAEAPSAPQSAPTPSDPVATAPASSSAVAQVQSMIPIQFQGKWDASLEGCGIPTSDGVLQIEPNRIDFYESSGNVQEVIPQGDLAMRVTADYFGEGETYTETDSFQLSSDGSTLTHVETNMVRYRCPN